MESGVLEGSSLMRSSIVAASEWDSGEEDFGVPSSPGSAAPGCTSESFILVLLSPPPIWNQFQMSYYYENIK
jgi:hypothetical protein